MIALKCKREESEEPGELQNQKREEWLSWRSQKGKHGRFSESRRVPNDKMGKEEESRRDPKSKKTQMGSLGEL